MKNDVKVSWLKNDTVYVATIPQAPLPEGTVLVHNNVIPRRRLGANGFRAWTQKFDGRLEICTCKWAGVDLHGLDHYRLGGNRKTLGMPGA